VAGPKKNREADLLAVVEAAYRLDCSDEEWLDGLLAGMRPHMDQGLGLAAFLFDISNPSKLHVGPLAIRELPADLIQTVAEGAIRADLTSARGAFRIGAASSASEADAGGEVFQWFSERLQPFGVKDAVFINAVDPSGLGCIISAAAGRVTRVWPRLKATWGRIGAHIAAGHRLRQRLARAGQQAGIEAVLSCTGKVEHAEDAAKSTAALASLRAASIAQSRARGGLRRADPMGALEEWKGLVAARWTLVDQFDHRGARYLVAKRNDAEMSGFAMLSLRERQAVGYAALGHTNKLIAYELGLSSSTVGVLLWRAASKLGTHSRGELIHCFLDAAARQQDAGAADADASTAAVGIVSNPKAKS
jgi:DNA-binding NarL/FixJ family response regulator